MKGMTNVFLVVVVISLLVSTTVAADRFALVIGNSKYAGEAVLENPSRDADAIEEALKDLDFTVLKKKDLNLEQMDEALVDFRRKLPKDGLGLFYFAGHGLQVEGTNYLVPVGARIREESQVKYQCLNVGQVLDMLDESEINLKVLVLDCCRNNPFKRGWKRGLEDHGLAKMNAIPKGTLTAYSTSPGKAADEGSGKNSPYTEALVSVLRSRPAGGLRLFDAFVDTRDRVETSTGQISYLEGDFSSALTRFQLRNVGTKDEKPAETSPRPPMIAQDAFAGSKAGELKEMGLGIKLRWCPPGRFTMGSPKSESGRSDDEDQAEVTLTKGYWLGETKVTQGQWKKVMKTSPWRDNIVVKDREGNAATNVSHDEASVYCQKLTKHEQDAGRLPRCSKYALPTEAQWEYACRAGTTTRFSSDESESELSNYGRSRDSDVLDDPLGVGLWRPNDWGLKDMHGNAEEWCADWKAYKLQGGRDPQGPGSGKSRVARGGSWLDYAVKCRCACRNGTLPEYGFSTLGFRIAAVRE